MRISVMLISEVITEQETGLKMLSKTLLSSD
jgi:hypothetical protein